MAEGLVMTHPSYLIIRTLFKPTPWKYEKAFIDQWTNGDTVEIIAPLIQQEIERWGGKSKRLVYVGTGRKRVYDIAIKSKPDVIPYSINDILTVRLPKDYQ